MHNLSLVECMAGCVRQGLLSEVEEISPPMHECMGSFLVTKLMQKVIQGNSATNLLLNSQFNLCQDTWLVAMLETLDKKATN